MFNRGIGDNFDKSTRIIVIQTLVLNVMNYCMSISGCTNVTRLHKIQKLQSFAAKVDIGGVNKCDRVTPILHERQWLTLKRQTFLT